MEVSEQTTVGQLRDGLEVFANRSDEVFRKKFSRSRLRRKALNGFMGRPSGKKGFGGSFYNRVRIWLMVAFLVVAGPWIMSATPFAYIGYLSSGLILALSVAGYILVNRLYFSRYRMNLMVYRGYGEGEYPMNFVSARARDSKVAFCHRGYRGLGRRLEPGDLVVAIENRKTDKTEAIVYLSLHDGCAAESFVRNFSKDDFLPGLVSEDEPLLTEFVHLANLFELNEHALQRCSQAGSRDTTKQLIVTQGPPAKEVSPEESTPTPKTTKPETPPRSADDDYRRFENQVAEDLKKKEARKAEGSRASEEISAFEELSQVVGLTAVKQQIIQLKQNLEADEKRKSAGIKVTRPTLHFVFLGNPGTGKTTVARILGKVLKEVGVVKKGSFTETSRSELIGSYIGHTAPKVDAVVDRALGGVLFIDEAYSLTSGGKNDFGDEAVTQLLKRMEDDREDLVVIVAGYEKEMETFLKSNSGLESRFTYTINFEDYRPDELATIFERYATKSNYKVEPEAKVEAEKKFSKALSQWNLAIDGKFSNGRFVRNYFDKCLMTQGQRILDPASTLEDIQTIRLVDIVNTAL